MTRRSFLTAAGAALVAACSGSGGGAGRPNPSSSGSSTAVPRLQGYPFTLGVASGDPTADGFVLWTRLAPEPREGGGMPQVEVPVRWQVASDESLRSVVREGTAIAGPDTAHSLHVEVEGLEPDRWYWYRFVAGDAESPVGRSRTFPAEGSPASRLRFGFASCQEYQAGYYAAWRDAAVGDLDLVLFLGDYIYEHGVESDGVRRHEGPAVVTLDEYRARYATYRGDPDLQAAHAAAPWIVTWDDHEVADNYTGVVAGAFDDPVLDPEEFRQRVAAGYRAWWEHMPVRLAAPTGPSLRVFGRSAFGDLALFHLLDSRQYRSDQVCNPVDIGAACDEMRRPEVTVLGAEQEAWLAEGLRGSAARWNVLANPMVLSRVAFTAGPDSAHNLDQWDGYPVARQRLLDLLAERKARNPVVVTGDIHLSAVSDVTADFLDAAAPVVGTELVGTSISSEGSDVIDQILPLALELNPHVRWAEGSKRGWVRCEVTPDALRAEFRHVDDVRDPDSKVRTATEWVVEDGRPVTPV